MGARGTNEQDRRRRSCWVRGTGRGPGGWPACARLRSRPPPGSRFRCYATPVRRRPPSPTAPSWWASRASGPPTWATPPSSGRATCLGPTPGRRRRPQATRRSRWSRPAARDILADVRIKPNKMAHCRARRDPNFETKTRDAPPPRERLSFREDEALSGHRLGPPRVRVRAQARLLAGPGRGRLLEDDPPDAVRHPGVQQGRARGEDPASPQRGGRRAGRLQTEVEPVGHGSDGRGARRGYPPFGWGRQGTLVAGHYTRRGTDRTPAGPIALGAATAWTGPVLRFRSRLGSPPARFQNHSTIAPV